MTKRTKQLIVLVLSIIMIAGSISYALWNRTLTQEGENRISAGCFDVSIDDKNDFIKLDDTYPMTDEMGMSLKPYTFKIKNTCTINANYNVYLNVLSDSTLDDENIKLQINDNNPKLLNAYVSNDSFDNKYRSSYIIDTSHVSGESYEGAGNGKEMEYEIRLWLKDMDLDDNYNNVADHSFKAQVSVEASAGLPIYQVGDIISLDIGRSKTEDFYVISETKDTVTALAKYDLFVGGYIIWSDQGSGTYEIIDKSLDGYNLQGCRLGEPEDSNYSYSIPCSDWFGYNYWYDDNTGNLKPEYSLKDNQQFPYIYDSNSLVYQYVVNYENILKIHYPSVATRLMSYEEAASVLGCEYNSHQCNNNYSWGDGSYWLGSAFDKESVFFISNKNIYSFQVLSDLYPPSLRPVIEIDKSDL